MKKKKKETENSTKKTKNFCFGSRYLFILKKQQKGVFLCRFLALYLNKIYTFFRVTHVEKFSLYLQKKFSLIYLKICFLL